MNLKSRSHLYNLSQISVNLIQNYLILAPNSGNLNIDFAFKHKKYLSSIFLQENKGEKIRNNSTEGETLVAIFYIYLKFKRIYIF